jgi:hypothetical protein
LRRGRLVHAKLKPLLSLSISSNNSLALKLLPKSLDIESLSFRVPFLQETSSRR